MKLTQKQLQWLFYAKVVADITMILGLCLILYVLIAKWLL
jgi:hypothetical protein